MPHHRLGLFPAALEKESHAPSPAGAVPGGTQKESHAPSPAGAVPGGKSLGVAGALTFIGAVFVSLMLTFLVWTAIIAGRVAPKKDRGKDG